MSSESQKRKAKNHLVYNGCDKVTDKHKGIYWYGKKARYENLKRYIRKELSEIGSEDGSLAEFGNASDC